MTENKSLNNKVLMKIPPQIKAVNNSMQTNDSTETESQGSAAEKETDKKKEAGWKKEQGHLFVPSCAAKSLTEAIVNDIGESLQSEELRGAEEGGKKRADR